jgi:hypothetical protein
MTCRQGDEVVQFGDGGKVGAEVDVAVVVPMGETTVFSSADVAKGTPRSATVSETKIERPTMMHRPFLSCLLFDYDNLLRLLAVSDGVIRGLC